MMETTPDLPIPISMIGGRHFLFSIDAVTYLRREHHICGVLIGCIPHVPQQNVFLGLPLELMPEEARLLVEKGLAYVVDDTRAHQDSIADPSMQGRRRYLQKLRSKGQEAATIQAGAKVRARSKYISRIQPQGTKDPSVKDTNKDGKDATKTAESTSEDSLFSPASVSEPASSNSLSNTTFGVTPATSASLYTPSPSSPLSESEFPTVPDSYPLFKHLHSKGYFASPGLRFGCQYLVYPGDPLRFHSHFLASHVGWDEELDLMDLVGGGRLGTVVKKGYLIGGLQTKKQEVKDEVQEAVRTFTIEWAGM